MTKETERFTLRLTSELKNQLDKSRKCMGISLNALVVQILWNWAEHQDKKVNKHDTQKDSEKVFSNFEKRQ